MRAASAERPEIDRALLLQLAHDLPRVSIPPRDTRYDHQPIEACKARLCHIVHEADAKTI